MKNRIEVVLFQVFDKDGKFVNEFCRATDLETWIFHNYQRVLGGKVAEVLMTYKIHPARFDRAEEHELLHEDHDGEYSIEEQFSELIKESRKQDLEVA